MPRTRTKALTLIKAADLLRTAENRLDRAKRAVEKAIKARDDAETTYLQIVSETLSARQQQPVRIGGEVSALASA